MRIEVTMVSLKPGVSGINSGKRQGPCSDDRAVGALCRFYRGNTLSNLAVFSRSEELQEVEVILSGYSMIAESFTE